LEVLVKAMWETAFRDRRVFVTGHTGFKGAWLTQWLLQLGAEVCGYALAAPSQPALFDLLNLKSQIQDIRADIRDRQQLSQAIEQWQPEFIFHLAAQSLVRASYAAPFETYEVNTLGTIQLLEALRCNPRRCVAIMVTSDKCYENQERRSGYREEDRLGGVDPYSTSKAMCELAIDSYQQAFFLGSPLRMASVRAGNVLGGGDWATDRIVPDCIRALMEDQPIAVRNPASQRPWQHVLEPLSGYLTLASELDRCHDKGRLRTLCSPFNFGPATVSHRSVQQLVEEIFLHWPGRWLDQSDPRALHEATLLSLNTEKAERLLGWASRWSFSKTVQETVEWYRKVHSGEDPIRLTLQQIASYQFCTSPQT
jgi:CDP-glucose 4,6-dehydratase